MEILISLVFMGIIFLIPVFVIYTIFNAIKKVLLLGFKIDDSVPDNTFQDGSNSLSQAGTLNDLLNETASKVSSNSGSQNSSNLSAAGITRMVKQSKNEKNKKTEASLTSATIHDNHDCEGVNYDQIEVLTGKSERFNLDADSVPEMPTNNKKLVITRNNLLRSFVMSEVLQRYDINRIYGRIPSARSND